MQGDKDILVVLTPGFPVDEADSTCLTSQQGLVRSLNARYPGIPVFVLTHGYPAHQNTYQWHGNTVIPFDGADKGKILKLRYWLRIWRTLYRLRREYHILGLFSFWCGEMAFIGSSFGHLFSLRHFIWILGQDARKGNRWVRLIRPRAGELVAMSEALAAEFQRNYQLRPGHIIPNGVDPAQFGVTPAERDIDLLGVGSLIPLKQYEQFLEVVKDLKLYMPGLRAVICGAGSEEGRLRAMIREWGLEDNVELAGERPHAEVLRYMQRSKLLLHPSSYEGYSTVCLEALCAGAHVVSYCNPKTGWVRHWHIVVGLPEMQERAREILEDPEREHGSVLVHTMDWVAKSVMELFAGDQNIPFYDAVADEYDGLMGQDAVNQLVRQRVANRFREFVREGRVLDFGGGTGLDMEWMTGQPYQIVFCEPSAGMRQKAILHHKNLLRHVPVEFLDDRQADFTNWQHALPFVVKVDGVLSNFAVFNSIENIDLLFCNLSLVLRPGGHLFALILSRAPVRKKRGWRSLLRRQRSRFSVKYKQYLQSVYLWPEKRLRRAAAPWFDFSGSESFDGAGFSLIHLVRK